MSNTLLSQPLDDAELSRERVTLAEIDRSCRLPVLVFIGSGIVWLLIGSLLALLASVKLHTPEFLTGWGWLSFGRVRPAHLNTVAYGWGAMTAIGVVLWMQARLSKIRLVFPWALTGVALAWNLAVAAGTLAILAGYGTSVEWLEFPLPVAIVLALLFGAFGTISFYTFASRRNTHVYISQWYIFAAILWFPYLYLVANFMILKSGTMGVVQASANWWFAHNVLGLFLTPVGLATIYYLIPKVIGAPIHSYYLSILGFWSLALFYNWAGTHHLVGGPLPAWMITVGIVGSMMMFVPVITLAVNHHVTMIGHFHMLKTSPTLRFIVFGGMSYTLVSAQGSFEALRWMSEVAHFTHYTVGHAHLGVYSFFSMTLFGAIYYILPRLTGLEWASARAIKLHFWSSGLGIALYWVALTWGGWFQGMKMNDPNVPFIDTVRYTLPYLWTRSLSGVLMTLGHLVLAWLVFKMIYQFLLSGPGPYARPQQIRPEAASTQPVEALS